jgi:hypothetical protein
MKVRSYEVQAGFPKKDRNNDGLVDSKDTVYSYLCTMTDGTQQLWSRQPTKDEMSQGA